MAELESSKAVTPLVAPVAGVIRYVNNEAADDPSIVTGDPYGEGWIFKSNLRMTSRDCFPPRNTPTSCSVNGTIREIGWEIIGIP